MVGPAPHPRPADLHRNRGRPQRSRRDGHGDEHYAWGRVRGWDPIGRYSQELWLGHAEESPTTLEVSFTEGDGGTLVHLEHGGWAPGSEEIREKYTHWGELLDRYAAHVS